MHLVVHPEFLAAYDFSKYFDSILHEHVSRVLGKQRFLVTDFENQALRSFASTPAPGPIIRAWTALVDEVGYILFGPDAAALFFALIASRYERASLIVSSNKTFSSRAEIFGDAVAMAAVVDRLIHHHAEVIVLQGDSYRLKDRVKESIASPSVHNAQFSTGVDMVVADMPQAVTATSADPAGVQMPGGRGGWDPLNLIETGRVGIPRPR